MLTVSITGGLSVLLFFFGKYPLMLFTPEPELLREAFARMPSLLVGEGDVLVVDETGKNYSGTGVDPPP